MGIYDGVIMGIQKKNTGIQLINYRDYRFFPTSGGEKTMFTMFMSTKNHLKTASALHHEFH
jgi:uncharacterized membrane protein YheB (UPF0754 family)